MQRLAAAKTARTARGARVLVMVPTRELAAADQRALRRLRPPPAPHAAPPSSAASASSLRSRALRRGVDILVATPGRLLDLISQRHVALGAVEVLVLDEADRMLDMGFIHDIRKIMALLPAQAADPAVLGHHAATTSPSWPAASCATRRGWRSRRSPRTAEQIDQRVLFVDRGDKRNAAGRGAAATRP